MASKMKVREQLNAYSGVWLLEAVIWFVWFARSSDNHWSGMSRLVSAVCIIVFLVVCTDHSGTETFVRWALRNATRKTKQAHVNHRVNRQNKRKLEAASAAEAHAEAAAVHAAVTEPVMVVEPEPEPAVAEATSATAPVQAAKQLDARHRAARYN